MAQGGNLDTHSLLKGTPGDGMDMLEKYGSIIKERMESLRQEILEAADQDMQQIEQCRRTLLLQVQRMIEEFDYKLREVGMGYASKRDDQSRENNVGCFSVIGRYASVDMDDPVAYIEEHITAVLDLLNDIQFNRENANSKLSIGHIVQPKILRLIASIKLPECPGHAKRSLTSLPDGSVVIGHESGGADIFRRDFGIKRLVNDVTVRDMTVRPDGTLVLLSFDRQIHVYSRKGEALQIHSPQETCFMFSVTADKDDMLFVGDCELEKIFLFDLKGDAKKAFRTIPTGATTPWQLFVLSTGNLLVADPCPPYGPAIKLVHQNGSILSAIHQEDWSSAWCAVDQNDNIYVVFSRKGVEKCVSIDVYSSEGKFFESLTRNLKIPKFQWLSVAVPCPGSIAICTETYLFVYTWQSQFR
ncbi:uncharacterized protein LOC129262381 [Lytechinus pictus]|uniref:uncharacterized protein LOC129262381 n=1 Tax=Lytechinus pictus TaxID=7653 RepID=UPI0030BA2217